VDPAGIFDPFGFAKGDLKEMQTKETSTCASGWGRQPAVA